VRWFRSQPQQQVDDLNQPQQQSQLFASCRRTNYPGRSIGEGCRPVAQQTFQFRSCRSLFRCRNSTPKRNRDFSKHAQLRIQHSSQVLAACRCPIRADVHRVPPVGKSPSEKRVTVLHAACGMTFGHPGNRNPINVDLPTPSGAQSIQPCQPAWERSARDHSSNASGLAVSVGQRFQRRATAELAVV